jgi:chemotaxis protein methyltransferase CheR
MRPSEIPEMLRGELSEFIVQKMGLHFPPERWADLQRGLAGAAAELGAADLAGFVLSLLSRGATRTQLQVLARHLTIGETYFFREKKTLDALVERILPAIIVARRNGSRRLRLWSAACCTGEEAYTLAILLQQVIPDFADWQVSILATDLNERFLQKAAAGVYGEWSFRDAPPWLKERYFRRTPEGQYAIVPGIKKLVTFAQLNLVEDVFPSLSTETNAMDIIFCRNVLMYFSLPQARKVVDNLRRALVDDGWLAVSPSESSQVLFADFATVNFPGVIVYRKGPVKMPGASAAPGWGPPVFSEPALPVFAPPPPLPVPVIKREVTPAKALVSPLDIASAHFAQGRYADAAETLLAALAAPAAPSAEAFSLLARALANQGRLPEALAWCERWLAAAKLEPAAHYLRAMVLQELGEPAQARASLQRAIYVNPQFILGHFAMGNLARDTGRPAEAEKHFVNALDLLRHCEPDAPLPEAEGLTAGRLTEIITSLAALAATP